MQQNEVSNRIGPGQCVLELHDCHVNAIFGRVHDPETVVGLLILRIAREQLLVDGFRLIEMPLTVIEVPEKARRFGGVGMSRDEFGKRCDRAIHVAGRDQLASVGNCGLLIGELVGVGVDDDAFALLPERPARHSEHCRQGQRQQGKSGEGTLDHGRYLNPTIAHRPKGP